MSVEWIKDEKHVLVIFPHPDDEAFGVSGTVMMLREKGIPVTYACLTLGEMGRNLGRPAIANRETLPLVRRRELEKACQLMDINLIPMGLRDKTIEFLDIEELADQIEQVIQETEPSLVLSFYPGYAVHPDHDACGAAVVHALKRMPANKRPTLYAIAITRDRIQKLGEPDLVIDVQDYLDRKLDVIKAHHSQMQETAAITEQKLKDGDKDAEQWLRYERYWIYKF